MIERLLESYYAQQSISALQNGAKKRTIARAQLDNENPFRGEEIATTSILKTDGYRDTTTSFKDPRPIYFFLFFVISPYIYI